MTLRCFFSALALLHGCAVDTSNFTAAECVDTVNLLALTGLTPASDVEGIAAVRAGSGVVAQWGSPCASAMDPSACQAAVRMATSPAGLFQACSGYCQRGPSLAVTRGGVVETIADRAALVRALGTIDTAQEALWVASASSLFVSCGSRATGSVRAVEGGFEVVGARGNGCDNDLVQVLLFVDRQGNVTQRNSAILRYRQLGCVT